MNFVLKKKINRVVGGSFLIAGTSIGAGMIGLPLKTLGMNFCLIVIVFSITWFVMLLTAFSMLEISLWVDGNINIISICKKILGKKFSLFVCVIYLLFLYALLTAYISGGSIMLIDLINVESYNKNYSVVVNLVFIIPFCVIVFFGIKFGDYINRVCVFLLIVLYGLLIYKIFPTCYIVIDNFQFFEYRLALASFPIIVTSFGYHLLIPSLKEYLFKDIKLLCITIVLGSCIPFFIYIIWEYIFTVMLINVSDSLFLNIAYECDNPIEHLTMIIGGNNSGVLFIISLFSFVALFSSLIGASLGLFDFFIDLFSFPRNIFKYRFLLLLLIFGVPLLFNVFLSRSFMFILGYAGVFASILLILIPSFILWYGRYIKHIKGPRIVFGGKIIIFMSMVFGVIIIFAEVV